MTRENSKTLTLLCIVISGCDAFVYLKCNDSNQGWLGQQSLLQCIVTVSSEARDTQIEQVTWVKEADENHPLVEFSKDTHHTAPGFAFAEPHWRADNLNVSMLVSRTVGAHTGSYKCVVNTNRGVCHNATILNVNVLYGPPTISVEPSSGGNDPGVAMTLSCDATGGSPLAEIRWYDKHHTDWTGSAQLTSSSTADGRFNLSSRLDLYPGSIFPEYTCAVYQAGDQLEGEARYTVPPSMEQYEDPKPKSNLAAKIIAPVVLIGGLIIGLLICRLLQRISSRSPNHDQCSEGELLTHSTPEEQCQTTVALK